MSRAFIDFYKEHNFMPNRVPDQHKGIHGKRRDALYRHLGIAPSFLAGRSVLEFGPGAGDNPVHTASYTPDLLVLVDGHDISAQECRNKADQGLFHAAHVEVVCQDVLSYDDERQFDLVIGEGLIHTQDNPKDFCKRMARFTKPGGLAIFTTLDAVSSFPDILRRMFKPLFAIRHPEVGECIKALAEFMKPDLDSLPGYARPYEDWVLDNLIHPMHPNPFFPFTDSVEALGDDFDVYASHPHFMIDWRWYKAIPGQEDYNQLSIEQYYSNLPFFIDCRLDPLSTPCDIDGRALASLCEQAYDLHLDLWENLNNDQFNLFISKIGEIRDLLTSFPATRQSLTTYIEGLQALKNGKQADFSDFHGWFGRGQMYVSYVRRT